MLCCLLSHGLDSTLTKTIWPLYQNWVLPTMMTIKFEMSLEFTGSTFLTSMTMSWWHLRSTPTLNKLLVSKKATDRYFSPKKGWCWCLAPLSTTLHIYFFFCLAEETEENHWPVASFRQNLSHNVVSIAHRHGRESNSVVKGTNYECRCKSNYNTLIITTNIVIFSSFLHQ